MTTPDTGALIQQIADQQTDIQRLTAERDSALEDARILRYRLEELDTRHNTTQRVISEVTRRQGAFQGRVTRLRSYFENPPKPFRDMTRGEALQFIQDIYDRITTPVPEDANEDTV